MPADFTPVEEYTLLTYSLPANIVAQDIADLFLAIAEEHETALITSVDLHSQLGAQPPAYAPVHPYAQPLLPGLLPLTAQPQPTPPETHVRVRLVPRPVGAE